MPCLNTNFDSEAPIAEESSCSQRRCAESKSRQAPVLRRSVLPVLSVDVAVVAVAESWSLGLSTGAVRSLPSRAQVHNSTYNKVAPTSPFAKREA